MNTVYLLSAWALLLLNAILLGVIRVQRKRHTREVINLVDDSTTNRDKVAQLREEIKNYKRVQYTDARMIERLLKISEQEVSVRMEYTVLLSRYRSLCGLAYERIQLVKNVLYDRDYQLVRDTLRALTNIETKPDGGIPTKRNGATEGDPS